VIRSEGSGGTLGMLAEGKALLGVLAEGKGLLGLIESAALVRSVKACCQWLCISRRSGRSALRASAQAQA